MKSPLTRLVIALVVFATTLVGYSIWYATISTKSAAVADLENQINSTIETASHVASSRAALAKITGDETTVQNYFVPEASVVAFITDLETRGRSQGATLNVVSVSSGDNIQQPTLVLALTINGTFDAVMRTVGTIEYAPFALALSELSLRKDSKNVWYADLKLSVGSVPAKPAALVPTQMPTP